MDKLFQIYNYEAKYREFAKHHHTPIFIPDDLKNLNLNSNEILTKKIWDVLVKTYRITEEVNMEFLKHCPRVKSRVLIAAINHPNKMGCFKIGNPSEVANKYITGLIKTFNVNIEKVAKSSDLKVLQDLISRGANPVELMLRVIREKEVNETAFRFILDAVMKPG